MVFPNPPGSFGLKDLSCFRVLEPPNSAFPDMPLIEIATPSRMYQLTGLRWGNHFLRCVRWDLAICVGCRERSLFAVCWTIAIMTTMTQSPDSDLTFPPHSEADIREWAWAIEGSLKYLRDMLAAAAADGAASAAAAAEGADAVAAAAEEPAVGPCCRAAARSFLLLILVATHHLQIAKELVVRKAGFLLKKGAKRHNWKKRWFAARGYGCVELRKRPI